MQDDRIDHETRLLARLCLRPQSSYRWPRAATWALAALLLFTPACDDHDHPHPHGDEHSHADGHAHDDDPSQAEEHSHGDEGHSHAEEDGHGHDHGDEGDSWAVTVWGDRFEIFAEIEPLAVGWTSKSHTHVTDLTDFSPAGSGRIAAVLKSADGGETVFEQAKTLRDGIFDILIAPTETGEYDLAFRVETDGRSEEIAAGRVRVELPGDHHGGLLENPSAPGTDGEPVPFLKEQQWRSAFATEWVRSGELADSVKGYGDVHPIAGGEVVLTAPIDAVVLAPDSNGPPWPYPGLAVTRDRGIFQLASQIHDEHSLSELAADVRVHESELDLVKANHARFQKLFEAGVISSQQTEETAAEVTEHQARLQAARDDLATARAARAGTGSAEVLTLDAPWSGRIAEVEITPGQAVEAGAPLARLVKTDPLWVEVKLRPADAARFSADPAGLQLSLPGLDQPVGFDAGEVRLVSRFPEIDPATGTVGVLLEVPGDRDALRLGSAVEAEILLPSAREGIVVPSSALVDDGGVSVVYLQLDGESFARQEVEVVAEQGERALVRGLVAGQRLVSLGGSAIRRAVLMTGAEAHGHQH